MSTVNLLDVIYIPPEEFTKTETSTAAASPDTPIHESTVTPLMQTVGIILSLFIFMASVAAVAAFAFKNKSGTAVKEGQ